MPRSFLILFAVIAILISGAVVGAVRMGWFRGRPDPLVLAEQSMRAGNLRGAQVELRNALRDHPKAAGPHLTMADLQLRLGDAVAAEKELTTARGLGADQWAVLPRLGRAYAEQNKDAELLRELPESGPNADVTTQLLVLRGGSQLRTKDVAGAAASLALAERASPGRADVEMLGARVALAHDDMAGAEVRVDAALKQDPAQLDALLTKHGLLLARHDVAGAMAVGDRAVAAAPWSVAARLNRANLLIGAGQDAKAREDVDAVLRNQPGQPFARYIRAVLLVRAGQDTDAAAELQRLEPFAQVVPRVLFYQAMVAGRLGQAKVAEDLAARYSRRVPGDASGSVLLAQTELGVRRPDLALAALQAIQGEAGNAPQVLDLLGTAYAALGRVAEAAESFGRAAAVAPDNASIAGHLGLLEARTGGPGTQQALDRLEALAPGQPATGEVLVRAAITAGELERAGTALDRLRKEAGETEAVGILAGTLAMARVDGAGAEKAFRETIERFPNSVNAKLSLSRMLMMDGRGKEAAAVLAGILASDRGNLAALTSYVQVEVQQKEFDAAIQALEAGRGSNPGNAGLAAMQAEVLAARGDMPGAVALLTSSIAAAPSPMLSMALARTQMQSGDVAAAKATLDAMMQASPADPTAWRAKIELLARTNDMDGAAAETAGALRRFPGDVRFMTMLLQLEARRKGADAAFRLAEDLRRDPANMPAAALMKGEVLFGARRFAEAAEVFRGEYQLAPTGPLLLALVHSYTAAGRGGEALAVTRERVAAHGDDLAALHLLSDLEVSSGEGEQAQKDLETLMAKGGGDAGTMNNLAWLYAQKKDARALPMARRAYLQQATPDTADTLGWTMIQLGNAGGAVPLLQRASAGRPEDPGIRYHLALALKESGKAEEAVRILQPVVAQTGEFPDKAAARELLTGLTAGK